MVAIPVSTSAVYLYTKAQDQYASIIGFTVKTSERQSPLDVLGGLSALGSGSSTDADILYEFLQSKSVVAKLDEKLNLKRIYSKNYDRDPLFSFQPNGTLEDLTTYWNEMVSVSYDKGSGLLEVTVKSFSAEDSHKISETLFKISSGLINNLSAIAREDTIGYSKNELQKSLERLQSARSNISKYRSEYKIIDPISEIEIQTGVIQTLQSKRSELLVELEILSSSVGATDPRILEVQNQIDVLERQILKERAKYSNLDSERSSYVNIVGTYEQLRVELDYAERTYLAAMSSYDSALTEAGRKTKYLAPYIDSTVAERPEYPKRLTLVLILAFLCFLIWLSLTFIFYAVRDRD